MIYDRLSLETQERILTATSHYNLDCKQFTIITFMVALKFITEERIPAIDVSAFSKFSAAFTVLDQSIISSNIASEADLFLEVIQRIEKHFEILDQDAWFRLAESYHHDLE